MGQPDEPLLPPDPPSPPRLKLWILFGAVVAVAGGAGVLWITRTGTPPAAEEPPATSTPDRAAPPAAKGGTPGPKASEPNPDGEEKAIRECYEAAEAFERAEPGEFETRMARWREVMTRFPTSSWARKADEKHRAAAASLQRFLDREFDSTRKDAQALAAAGHFVDAIETIQSYKSAQTRELLKRRADVEITAIENQSRLAYNEAVVKAKDLAAKRDYAGASALLEAVSRTAIPEVVARCKTGLAQLKTAAEEDARHAEARKGDEARKQIRDELAPKVLTLVRARQFDDALKELSAAAASHPTLKDELIAERAAVADAASFWEAFLKTLRAKSGQETSILLSDGKRVVGKLSRVQPDRVVLDVGEGTAEAPLDRIHADLIVGWTIGRSLAAEEPVTYLKAAMFFFGEGRDDLARLYLATARELNGSIDAAEKVFRGGYLRAALSVKR